MQMALVAHKASMTFTYVGELPSLICVTGHSVPPKLTSCIGTHVSLCRMCALPKQRQLPFLEIYI